MGYAEALFGRDYAREEKSLRSKAKKKGLWGSIGRTLGGLAATALTGGAAAPWAMGLAAGAGTLAGGALGAAASRQKLKGGTFMQEDRASLERELGAFGERNIVGGLKAAVTAGIGQKLKLGKEAASAKEAAVAAGTPLTDEAVKTLGRGKGFDFAESAVGRGLQKAKLAAGPTVERATLSPMAQKMASDPMGTMKGIEVTTAGKEAKLSEFLGGESAFATEFGAGGGSRSKRFAQSMNQPINVSEFNVQKPLDQSYEFGVGARGGSAQIDLTAQDLSRSGKFMPSAEDLSKFSDPALEHQLQLESLQSAGKKLPPDTPGIFPGKSMGDYFTGGKNLKGAANKAYMESLAGNQGDVLESLTYGRTKPVIGTGGDIMEAALEGYNEPYGIKDVYGVGTGKGIDVDRISSQTTRSGFMDELALGKSLESRLGRTFDLPSTTRGYDYQTASAGKAGEISEMLKYSGLRSSIGRR